MSLIELPQGSGQLVDPHGNVIPFAREDGSGMPSDRSGSSFSERWNKEKQAKKSDKQREEFIKAMQQPVSKGEYQRAMFQVFGSMEKVVAEFRKLAVMNEALRRVLYTQGTITKEDYERETQNQYDWNTKIDEILRAIDAKTPLNEVVRLVSDWNNTKDLKITWQHIDLAVHIINDEGLTLEEKLQIAADMEMPEVFLEDLRTRDTAEYAAKLAEGISTEE